MVVVGGGGGDMLQRATGSIQTLGHCGEDSEQRFLFITELFMK